MKIKWLLLGIFVFAGMFMVIITPGAVENMLPEVQTVFPEKRDYRETVRGTGVIYGSESGGFFLRAAVRERDINAVKIGQPAEIYGVAIGDGDYAATVMEIASVARQQEVGGVSETVVDVILRIKTSDNPKELLRSGYTAEAIIGVDEPREILLIPYQAINQDDKGEYVLVLVGNTAIRRDIITGIELAEGTELISGIRENHELILKPELYGENVLVKK
ncbi:MAG: hypothetical protein FWH08_01930 [Oscillospiraceae bacterium]|nr:hypothetical protein [Oscillospiraceae bacterium]